MSRSCSSRVSFCFLFIGLLFLFFVVTHVVLHRVSIRTLSEPLWLCAGWGSVESSMLPVFGRPRSGPNPTRSHRNTGSSQQVNMISFLRLLRHGTGRMAPG